MFGDLAPGSDFDRADTTRSKIMAAVMVIE